MMQLPAQLGGKGLVAWRLDQAQFRKTWDSGIGAFQSGGRWNMPGMYAVYCALDPATAILEVAVHKGFEALDLVPHVLTSLEIADPKKIFVVKPENVPNQNWLVPGMVSAGQQKFGSDLLKKHDYILVPSVVSRYSWNLVFDAEKTKDAYKVRSQEGFALDPRLSPETPFPKVEPKVVEPLKKKRAASRRMHKK